MIKSIGGDNMFLYDERPKEKSLFVTIPSKIQYNFAFLNNITELLEQVEKSSYEKILIDCGTDPINYNKMCTAYLLNTLLFLAQTKTVFAKNNLLQIFHETVSHSDGKQFEKIDITKDSLSQTQQCYCIRDDKAVSQTVHILGEFIGSHNLMFENAKEFLITTIGEIFSNAFNHSSENKVFFMYDIEWHNDDVYLIINVTDYGKTIVHNVQKYYQEKYGQTIEAMESIRWAMGIGNTTRLGSGGYGLPTLVNYVSKANGELLIFSGNVIFALKGSKQNILYAKGTLSGTSISMKIPLFDTSRAFLYDEDRKEFMSMNLDQI